MHSKYFKTGAVIAIMLMATLMGLNQFQNPLESVTWANVIDPLMTARTAVFDVVTEYQGHTSEAKLLVMGHLIRYELKPGQGPPIIIFDTETFQMLNMIPEQKRGWLIDLKNLPDEAPENYLESVRDVIKTLQNDPDVSINQLPDSSVDGQNTIVFRARNAQDEITVWADPETLIPVRLDQTENGLHVVCTNFQFDIDLAPSLFSMDIPEGYSTVSGELNLGNLAEKDLVEGMRIWAQTLEDNQFPEDLSAAVYMNKMPEVLERLKNGTLKLSQQQKLDMALQMGQCLQFVGTLKPEQDWHYVGAGVPFGDASQPVGWYKPIGSETYRVIYGDLSVKELNAENLPE
ncbi:MAG: hypothetical protein HQ515_02205 [Phycisphaeraceae bacterium]|nr:hypothetical protein [Phycisphaeraceae bacterium]